MNVGVGVVVGVEVPVGVQVGGNVGVARTAGVGVPISATPCRRSDRATGACDGGNGLSEISGWTKMAAYHKQTVIVMNNAISVAARANRSLIPAEHHGPLLA